MDNLTFICFREELFGNNERLMALIDKFSSFAGSKMLTFESNVPLDTTLVRGAEIIAQLQKRGLNSASLTGADLDCMRGSEDGVARVDASMFKLLLAQDIAPVLLPLSHDTEAHYINSKHTDVATQAAIALSWHYNVTLILCDDELDAKLKTIIDTRELSEIQYKSIALEQHFNDETLNALFGALNMGLQRVIVVAADNLGTVNAISLTIEGNL